jgi:hypothetical protein
MRRVNYRAAGTMLVFSGLWFVLGAILLLSPIPGALGIGYRMFVAWLMLFLLMLAASGFGLTLAAINGIFPPPARAPRPSVRPAPPESLTHDAEGRPLPWTQSPLPQESTRRTTTLTRTTTSPHAPSDPRRGG